MHESHFPLRISHFPLYLRIMTIGTKMAYIEFDIFYFSQHIFTKVSLIVSHRCRKKLMEY